MSAITTLDGVEIQANGVAVSSSPKIINIVSPLTAEETPTGTVKITSERKTCLITQLNSAVVAGATNYITFGASSVSTGQGTYLSYLGAGTLKNLRFAGLGNGTGTATITLMKQNTATSLTKAINISTSWATDIDNVNSVVLTAADWVAFRIVVTGANLTNASIYVEFIPS